MKKRRISNLLILISSVMFIGFLLMASFVIRQEFNHIDNIYNDYLKTIADISANDNRVIVYVSSNDPQINDVINQYLEEVPKISLIEVVTVNRIIIASQDTQYIGQYYDDDEIENALIQDEYVSTSSSSVYGEARKAFVPIYDGGNQVGVVITQILEKDITAEKTQKAFTLGGGFLLGYLISIVGLYFLSKRYASDLLGYNPREISMLFAEQKSIIDQLGEGIITVDNNLKILTINNAMQKMFSLNDYTGKNIEDVFPYVDFRDIIHNNVQIEKKYRKINDNKYLMDAFPLYHNNKIIGASAIFRVHHEHDALLDQLDGYRQINEGLRSQKHEFQNKLHVILGLIKMKDYKQAENYIMENVYTTNLASDYYTSRLKDDKVIALFVGKEMQCKEHGVTLLLTSDSYLEKSHLALSSDDILLVLGNLIDNALEAYVDSDIEEKRIVVDIFEDEEEIRITVIDQAGGIDPQIEKHMFERGISTKGGKSRGTGLSLVQEVITLYQGEKKVQSSIEETRIEIVLRKVIQ